MFLEKYLLSFHNELLKFLPVPYDYLLMFVLGYYFMKIFTGGKNCSNFTKSKKKNEDLNSENDAIIKNELKYIKKIEEEIRKKYKNGEKIQKKSSKINIDMEKLDNIDKKLSGLMNDLNERSKDNSNEKSMLNNICEIQDKILDIVNKEEEEEEGEVEEHKEQEEKKEKEAKKEQEEEQEEEEEEESNESEEH